MSFEREQLRRVKVNQSAKAAKAFAPLRQRRDRLRLAAPPKLPPIPRAL
jgi:hypothetical protein